MDKSTALILEGGGLRGVYTSGALRFLMDEGLYFPYVIGSSMGACTAASYVSRQPERNRIVNTRYVNDPRYINYANLLRRGELFNMDFIFDTVPRCLVHFDYETFRQSPQRCITTATDCLSGQPLYFDKPDSIDDYMLMLQASCSLPFIARPVRLNGRTCMDGGIADAVPIRRSLADGNRRNVLILTRHRGYRKQRSRLALLSFLRYPHFAGMCRALVTRFRRYNETMDLIDKLEKQGTLFVIRPQSPLGVGRVERDKDKLYAAYDQGYHEALGCSAALKAYLARSAP